MDGILNINKPVGRSSFSIVSLVRRLSGEKRVGHAGTLDPIASGVLPVCLGQGTRVVEFFQDMTKVYRAEIELGVSTDTYDATGRTIQEKNPSGISRYQLESALALFCGEIKQTPPMYSALKYHGEPLYKLARAGISIERKSRPVKIHKLELLDFSSPTFTIDVTCGKGVYIRSLANDLGEALGCGANLRNLTRLKYGIFDVAEATSVYQLEAAFCHGYWQNLLYPIDSCLTCWEATVVGSDSEQFIKNGRPLVLEAPSDVDRCRAYNTDGYFCGMLRFNPQKGQWQPEKVFSFPQTCHSGRSPDIPITLIGTTEESLPYCHCETIPDEIGKATCPPYTCSPYKFFGRREQSGWGK